MTLLSPLIKPTTAATSDSVSPREQPSLAIARNVVIARDLADMTQHDLAARAGISRATIAQLESGEADPRYTTLSDVAQALEISPLVLLAGRRDVLALAGLCAELARLSVTIGSQDEARMRAFVAGGEIRDLRRAARLGASAARAAGCTTPGAQRAAGLFSAIAPGRGTTAGALLGRLLG